MSARRATVRPGLPPFRMPTTPVRATPVRTSSPRPRRCSATRLRGPRLLVAEFRVLVDVPPPGDQLLLDGRGPLPHLRLQGGAIRTPLTRNGHERYHGQSNGRGSSRVTHRQIPYYSLVPKHNSAQYESAPDAVGKSPSRGSISHDFWRRPRAGQEAPTCRRGLSRASRSDGAVGQAPIKVRRRRSSDCSITRPSSAAT